MIQRIFFFQRTDHGFACSLQLRFAVQQNLRRDTSLADQQRIHVFHTVCRHTVDRHDKLASLRLNARLRQRRTQRLAPGSARQDLFQTEETTLITGDLSA